MEDDKGLLSQRPDVEVADYLICTCMGVMRSEIAAAIKAGATTFDALQEKLLVGTGCSSCVEEIEGMLRRGG